MERIVDVIDPYGPDDMWLPVKRKGRAAGAKKFNACTGLKAQQAAPRRTPKRSDRP